MSPKDDAPGAGDSDVTALAPGPSSRAPSTVDDRFGGDLLGGRWEVLGVLGVGGMGTVYRARDLELEETVALKVVRRDVFDPGMADRFRREVKLARRVSHRNVARVFELGEHRGERFFTMELVEGESLRCLLDRSGPLSLERVVALGCAIARGLEAAHAAEVVHRDLKPDNVLLGTDGRVVLTDFGIAASLERSGAASTTSFAGTAAYMAPEQVDRQSPITPLSDIYAFGAVLYEMVTGAPPFTGETQLAIAVARLTADAPDPRKLRPALPTDLADLLMQCLARDPRRRVASAALLQSRLAAIGSAGEVDGDSVQRGLAPRGSPEAHHAPWDASSPTAKIAVLPLANTGSEDDAFIADGLTDDLVDALSSSRRLRVIARSLTERYGSRRDIDPRTLRAELGATAIVSGTLRRMPDRTLQLVLRLVNASDGVQVWSKRFAVTEGKLLEVNEEAARAIALALSASGPGRERHLTNPAAVELYLRARAHYRDFLPNSAGTAVGLFEQALAIVPDDPVLLAGKAMSLARVAFFRGTHLDEAEATARRALAGVPDSAEAHLALATVHLQRGSLHEALRGALAAASLAPSLGEAHQLIARILAETGPAEAAQRAIALAIEIDPRVGPVHLARAQVLATSGRIDEARAAVDDVRAALGQHPSLHLADARFALWCGDQAVLAEAAAAIIRLPSANPSPQRGIALRFGRILDPSTADEVVAAPEALLEELASSLRLYLFFLQMLVDVAASRGHLAKAAELVELAVARGLSDLLWLDGTPLLAPLRREERWAALRAPVVARAQAVWDVLVGGPVRSR